MANQGLEKFRIAVCQNIEKSCLNCKSHRPCPPLIVIATRYAQEIARASGR
jgi:hypothetical protein